MHTGETRPTLGDGPAGTTLSFSGSTCLNPGSQAVGGWAFLTLMAGAHAKIARAMLSNLRHQSRLMLAVLALFVFGYLVIGFLIFHGGLSYLNTFPLVGPLLTRRVLFLLLAFFFVMLLFSNLVVGYGGMFRSRDTAWLMTLPIASRDVYRWKLLEHIVVSSWALLFFIAPLLLAYTLVLDGGIGFFALAWLLLIPFVVIPAVSASFISLLLARFFSAHTVKWAFWLGGLAVLFFIALQIAPTSTDLNEASADLLSINQILKKSEFVQGDGLPSAWITRSLIALSVEFQAEAFFYALLLTSYALVGISLASRVGSRLFLNSWMRAAEMEGHGAPGGTNAERSTMHPWERILNLLPAPGPSKAMLIKDQLLFWRDPAQWSQFLIFFGLLGIYIVNLRYISVDVSSLFWSTVISYLNLGSMALTLSTLTTRFVFPQFSIEGRRLWILGMSPFGLKRVVYQKFVTSALFSGGLTVALMVVSSSVLQLPIANTLIFSSAVGLLAAGLSGLAVGLGTLFPNLREENPAKIVSGFGGTLCLVLSFVFIVVMLFILVIPAFFQDRSANMPLFRWDLPTLVACIGAITLGLFTTILPMRLALRRVSSMEL
ncbi:MAG: hypothetical protein SNJ52_01360 [Verrucomicrobiia bacterium]